MPVKNNPVPITSPQRLPLAPETDEALVAFHILSLYWFFLPSKIAWKCFSAGKVSSGEIRPSQWNFASKTEKLQYTEPIRERSFSNKSIFRAKSLSSRSLRLSRTQWKHISLIKSQTGSKTTILIFSWFYMSSATSLSVSVFMSSRFCCHFLFVLHTCDFLPSHHKIPPNKTICTAIATF